ncbi:hypothetical protein AGDE_12828 [Angomonas deanei]|uniref:Uncharacterized protein n=1 Tax=Angomonas deanei TaxID=59799 RepID=A0A7G2CL92_9TRYP|nr:hypothetical protein AGDE_12828 [Angomonas deanei]CAD2219012.1 hypothetical protein, conserved [Angomonas deanei]|eukprot:EPY23419.1 hypothetical protein AGDE_12828 [Angomonas deanei]
MNFNSRPTPQLCRYTTLPNSPIANAKLNPRTSLSGRLPTVLVPLSNTKEELKHLNSENSNLGTRSDATPREEQPMPIQCNSPPGDSIPHFVRNTSGSSLGRRLSASHSTKPPISQSMSTNPMPRYGRLQPLPFQDDVPADDTSNGGSQRSLADVYRFNQQHSSQKKKGRLVLGDK